ncbi:hypothetical protein RHI9324_00568 [Rhizobium sp. CECT 9324]|nr:hypothetical protein RHI9324_00568 [Rhizobium sp. CECT 9324]
MHGICSQTSLSFPMIPMAGEMLALRYCIWPTV